MILFSICVKRQSFYSLGCGNSLFLIIPTMMSSNIKPLDIIHLGSWSHRSFCLNGYITWQFVKVIFLMEIRIHCQVVEMSSTYFFLLEWRQPSNLDNISLMDVHWDLNPYKKSCGSFNGTNSLIIWEYLGEKY